MWPSIRQRALCLSSEAIHQWKSDLNRLFCSSVINATNANGKSGNVVELLNLEEVEKILRDVRADDVRVIPVKSQSEFANFVVVATGKSQWHVRNIAQALIYKVKQKQPGAKRMLLPSVEGQEGGNWIVIDSGIHSIFLYGNNSLLQTNGPGKSHSKVGYGSGEKYADVTSTSRVERLFL